MQWVLHTPNQTHLRQEINETTEMTTWHSPTVLAAMPRIRMGKTSAGTEDVDELNFWRMAQEQSTQENQPEPFRQVFDTAVEFCVPCSTSTRQSYTFFTCWFHFTTISE